MAPTHGFVLLVVDLEVLRPAAIGTTVAVQVIDLLGSLWLHWTTTSVMRYPGVASFVHIRTMKGPSVLSFSIHISMAAAFAAWRV